MAPAARAGWRAYVAAAPGYPRAAALAAAPALGAWLARHALPPAPDLAAAMAAAAAEADREGGGAGAALCGLHRLCPAASPAAVVALAEWLDDITDDL